MTPSELTRQEEHLFAVLSGKRFLKMEGLSNEVPFFIYPYEPEHALEVAKAKKRVKNRLASRGIQVREINLYDLSVDIEEKHNKLGLSHNEWWVHSSTVAHALGLDPLKRVEV